MPRKTPCFVSINHGNPPHYTAHISFSCNNRIASKLLPWAKWGRDDNLCDKRHVVCVHNKEFRNRVRSTWLHRERMWDSNHYSNKSEPTAHRQQCGDIPPLDRRWKRCWGTGARRTRCTRWCGPRCRWTGRRPRASLRVTTTGPDWTRTSPLDGRGRFSVESWFVSSTPRLGNTHAFHSESWSTIDITAFSGDFVGLNYTDANVAFRWPVLEFWKF